MWEGGHRRLLTWQWLYQEYRGMQDTGYDLLTCMAVGLKVSVAKMWACAGMYLTTCLQLGGDWLHTQLALPITLFFFFFYFFLVFVCVFMCACVCACACVEEKKRVIKTCLSATSTVHWRASLQGDQLQLVLQQKRSCLQ